MQNREAKAVSRKPRNLKERRKTRKRNSDPSGIIDLPANPIKDLPPNESIRKYPDEVYGDSLIPHRKRR